MRKKCSKWIAGMLCAICLAGSVQVSAAEKKNVSKTEYSLPVEDVPQSVEGTVYAKLHNTSDASGYLLSLFESYDALVQIQDTLKDAGESLSGIEYLAVEVMLYERDSEGDYYPTDGKEAMTILCPVPESLKSQADKLQMISISQSGGLERISSELVTVSGVKYVQFDAYSEKTYAFLVKESGTLTSGVAPTATPVPTKVPEATVTPVPTKKPEATVTPKPTKAPEATVTPAPTKKAETTTAPVPTKTPEATVVPKPTKAPTPTVKPPAGNSSGSTPSGEKDKTPQTGDGFSKEGNQLLLVIGAILCVGSAVLYKRVSVEKEK